MLPNIALDNPRIIKIFPKKYIRLIWKVEKFINYELIKLALFMRTIIPTLVFEIFLIIFINNH